MSPARAEELRLIEDAVKSGMVRRFPMGGGVLTAPDAVAFLKGRGYRVTNRHGSYRVTGQKKAMSAIGVMTFAAHVQVTDAYPSKSQRHAAQKAAFATQMGLKPRKVA